MCRRTEILQAAVLQIGFSENQQALSSNVPKSGLFFNGGFIVVGTNSEFWSQF
jgi:hypothetical protein